MPEIARFYGIVIKMYFRISMQSMVSMWEFLRSNRWK